MTYFPSGFWSRLITRILADEQITESINLMYELQNEKNNDLDLKYLLKNNTQWKLWQTGISLCFDDIIMMKIWEIPFNSSSVLRNNGIRFKLKLDGLWNDINVATSSILEISLSLTNISIQKIRNDNEYEILGILEPNFRIFAKFLALIVDHIDLLLEDWYPSLGTRFVHTSEGRFLVTRLVLCPECLRKLYNNGNTINNHLQSPKNLMMKYPTINSRRLFSDVYGSNSFGLFPVYPDARLERNSQVKKKKKLKSKFFLNKN